MQEVTAITEGCIKMGPGTLYGSIKRMLASGLIAETQERPVPERDDERRRYYKLTGFGQRVVAAVRVNMVISIASGHGVIAAASAIYGNILC